jgi:hypothetical protein
VLLSQVQYQGLLTTKINSEGEKYTRRYCVLQRNNLQLYHTKQSYQVQLVSLSDLDDAWYNVHVKVSGSDAASSIIAYAAFARYDE